MGCRWLEPCAVKVARTVLRRGGGSNPFPLFDFLVDLGDCGPPYHIYDGTVAGNRSLDTSDMADVRRGANENINFNPARMR